MGCPTEEDWKTSVKIVTMTDAQACAAMFHFLEDFYFRTKSDDVGSLLGSMPLLPDGGTADPAVAKDWRKAVNRH